MKAPDKMYLVEWDNKGISEYDTPWSPAPYGNRNCKNHEYIRKDALMEWLEKRRDAWDDGVMIGNKTVFQQVIDKINSI